MIGGFFRDLRATVDGGFFLRAQSEFRHPVFTATAS